MQSKYKCDFKNYNEFSQLRFFLHNYQQEFVTSYNLLQDWENTFLLICRSTSGSSLTQVQHAECLICLKDFVIIPLHCYRLHCAAVGVCFLKQIFRKKPYWDTLSILALSQKDRQRSQDKHIYVLFKTPFPNQVNERKRVVQHYQ